MDDNKIREVIGRYRSFIAGEGANSATDQPAHFDRATGPTGGARPFDAARYVADMRQFFTAMGVKPVYFGLEKKTTGAESVLGHCSQMLDQMDAFLAQGRRDKALRWVGFIRGCIYGIAAVEGTLGACSAVMTAMEDCLAAADRDGAFLGLGFVQGVLFATGRFSIGELADHSRPDQPARG